MEKLFNQLTISNSYKHFSSLRVLNIKQHFNSFTFKNISKSITFHNFNCYKHLTVLTGLNYRPDGDSLNSSVSRVVGDVSGLDVEDLPIPVNEAPIPETQKNQEKKESANGKTCWISES